MRRKVKVGLGIAVIGAAIGIYQLTAAEPGNRVFGPYVCSACRIDVPVPDNATAAYINKMDNGGGIFNPGNLNLHIGDKVMMCNGSYCATYVYSDSRNFYAEKRTERTKSGGGGGGGTGSGNGPGTGPGTGGSGGGGGGGCFGKCGEGLVVVRPVQPAP